METTLNNVRSLIVNTIQKSKSELVDILNKTGIPTSYHDSKEKIRQNVVKALSVSNKFKDRLMELIKKNHIGDVKNILKTDTKTKKLGFASQPLYQRTLPLDEEGYEYYEPVDGNPFPEAVIFTQEYASPSISIGMNGSFGADGTIHPTANPYGSDFHFRADGTPNTQNESTIDKVVGWLNKALGIYSEVVKQNPANETDKLAQLQAQLDAEKQKRKKAWIVPTILATIVTATVVYMVLKNKK